MTPPEITEPWDPDPHGDPATTDPAGADPRGPVRLSAPAGRNVLGVDPGRSGSPSRGVDISKLPNPPERGHVSRESGRPLDLRGGGVEISRRRPEIQQAARTSRTAADYQFPQDPSSEPHPLADLRERPESHRPESTTFRRDPGFP